MLLDFLQGIMGNGQQTPNNLEWLQPKIASGEVPQLNNQQWTQQMQQIDANQSLPTQMQNLFSGNWNAPINAMAAVNQGALPASGMQDPSAEALRQKLVMQALGGVQQQQQEQMPQPPIQAPVMPSRFAQQQQAPDFSPMSLSGMQSMQQQALAQPMMLNQAAMQKRKFLGGN